MILVHDVLCVGSINGFRLLVLLRHFIENRLVCCSFYDDLLEKGEMSCIIRSTCLLHIKVDNDLIFFQKRMMIQTKTVCIPSNNIQLQVNFDVKKWFQDKIVDQLVVETENK